MDLSFFANATFFCFLDLSKQKLCRILVSGTVRFNKVVWINHDNDASRGAVGRTHFIVRLQTRIRRKDGSENCGVSYICGMDLHNGILCCGFLCSRIISLCFSTFFLSLPCVFSVSLLRLPRQGLSRPIYIARAITPSPLHGYHAFVFTSRLPRHSSEFHFLIITPELSRYTTHVNRLITPALVSGS